MDRLASRRLASRPPAVSALPALLHAAELWPEHLAAQRPLDELDGTRSLHQPAALAPVGGQHCIKASRWQIAAEFGARATITIACAGHARRHMVPGERSERNRVTPQHAVQPVVGRCYVEQPGHGGLLELLAARRMDASRPAGRKIGCHHFTLPYIEQMF